MRSWYRYGRGRSPGHPSPRAVVYRGRSKVDRLCADTAADLLHRSRWGFEVEFAGPRGPRPLSGDVLSGAALYVQPGGGTLRRSYRRLRHQASDVQGYVGGGGRYLGFCLGGYLAGATPGFGLLPGDTDRYIDLPAADAVDDGDTAVPVLWRGRRRTVFFQDGPHFLVEESDEVDVVARYTNGAVAALVAPYGRGRVAVAGPHPEATADWFDDVDPSARPEDCRDLALDLLDSVMRA